MLVESMALLPVTALLLRLGGLQRCREVLSLFIPADSAPECLTTEETHIQARQISRMVNAAARYGIYRANCLQRSVLLWWMLRRRGIDGELYLGARKGDGRFEAHAWVELAGAVLNDRRDVREQYASFDRAIVGNRRD